MTVKILVPSNIKHVVTTKELSSEEKLNLFKIIGHYTIEKTYLQKDWWKQRPFTFDTKTYFIDYYLSEDDKRWMDNLSRMFNCKMIFINYKDLLTGKENG